MIMAHRFPSGPLQLAGHLALPPGRVTPGIPGLVLCHGYPAGVGGASTSAQTFPELADRIATELGWVVLAFTFRGAGASEGNFSLGGWLRDIQAASDHLRAETGVNRIWLTGFGTGGALSVCAGAADSRIKGVAALAAPADFEDWAGHPRRLLEHSREIGLIKQAGFPPSFDTWARELKEIRAVGSVAELAPRPLLVVHGTDDEIVPGIDARVLCDEHGHAELRLIAGAAHRLRHDPRAVAILLGWLDRQRHTAV